MDCPDIRTGIHFQGWKTERHVCRVVIQEILFLVCQMSLFLGPGLTESFPYWPSLLWLQLLKPYGAVGTMTLCCGIPSWNAEAFVEFSSGLFFSVLSFVWSTLKSLALILDRYSLLVWFFLEAVVQFPRCLDFIGYLELRLKSVTLLGLLSSFS